eukprot:12062532-Prorocentrum_lima.AAC.1
MAPETSRCNLLAEPCLLRYQCRMLGDPAEVVDVAQWCRGYTALKTTTLVVDGAVVKDCNNGNHV